MARRNRRRLLLWLAGGVGGFVGLVAAAGYVTLARLPGGIEQVDFGPVLSAGEIHYSLPNEYLQAQLGTGFPRTFFLTSTLEAVVEEPRLVPDDDGDFLRLAIVMRTREGAPAHRTSQPGTATLRGQLAFNRAAGTVVLTQVQLLTVDLAGEFAGTSNLLLPMLRYLVGPALEGTVVLTLPREAGFWQRTGMDLVRDIRVENGHVVVVIGRPG